MDYLNNIKLRKETKWAIGIFVGVLLVVLIVRVCERENRVSQFVIIDNFPGTDVGVRLNNCLIAASKSTTQTCDATTLNGVTDVSNTQVIVPAGVRLLLSQVRIRLFTPNIYMVIVGNNSSIYGQGAGASGYEQTRFAQQSLLGNGISGNCSNHNPCGTGNITVGVHVENVSFTNENGTNTGTGLDWSGFQRSQFNGVMFRQWGLGLLCNSAVFTANNVAFRDVNVQDLSGNMYASWMNGTCNSNYFYNFYAALSSGSSAKLFKIGTSASGIDQPNQNACFGCTFEEAGGQNGTAFDIEGASDFALVSPRFEGFGTGVYVNPTYCSAIAHVQIRYPQFSSTRIPVNNKCSGLDAGAGQTLQGFAKLSSGSATIRFNPAFMYPPVCVCTDTNSVASVRCNPSLGQLLINGQGTDTIAYHCNLNPY